MGVGGSPWEEVFLLGWLAWKPPLAHLSRVKSWEIHFSDLSQILPPVLFSLTFTQDNFHSLLSWAAECLRTYSASL